MTVSYKRTCLRLLFLRHLLYIIPNQLEIPEFERKKLLIVFLSFSHPTLFGAEEKLNDYIAVALCVYCRKQKSKFAKQNQSTGILYVSTCIPYMGQF